MIFIHFWKMKWRKFLNRLGLILISVTIFSAGVIFWSHTEIESASNNYIFNSLIDIPKSRVGLLLGTSKYNRAGGANLFFRYRIDAAISLYQNHKIDYILVSGDNRTLSYNEPRDMRKALLARGIPDSAIYLDYAGLRTFDSVVRCKKVFGQSAFIIISQEFHLERALFIAQHVGIYAIGYAAKNVPEAYSIKTSIREYFARTKAVLDIFILATKPRFLGDSVIIGKQK
jgi:SanA protein